MNIDEILAGVGGALSGGLRGYSWAKEMDQEDEQQRERERARRDQNNNRGVDLMLTERGLMNDEEEGRRKVASTERDKRIYDEWFQTLTPEMQRFISAKKIGGVTTDAEDWKTDAQRALEKKDAIGQKYLDAELSQTRTLETEAVRHANRLNEVKAGRRAPALPVSERDNPALPRSVVDLLADLSDQNETATAAAAAFTERLPELLRANPRLDPALAQKRLTALYGLPVRPSTRRMQRTAPQSELEGRSPRSAAPNLDSVIGAATSAKTLMAEVSRLRAAGRHDEADRKAAQLRQLVGGRQ